MELNRVTLIGTLVRDTKSRARPGQKITTFTLATSASWNDGVPDLQREPVEHHDVEAFGKLAEIISQYVKKGSKVYIEGRLRRTNGKTHVVADNMIMLGHRRTP